MRHAAVDDDDAFDARFDNLDATFDLRNHAAGDRTVLDQGVNFVRRQFVDEVLLALEYARNIS
jgi:hypothetical protein